jgi:hypothetical protein
MKFNVIQQNSVEVNIPDKELIEGVISILKDRINLNTDNYYFSFYKKDNKYFGKYEIYTHTCSTFTDDITEHLYEDEKKAVDTIIFLEELNKL